MEEASDCDSRAFRAGWPRAERYRP